nr:hypothetical protein [Klebsiella pneumoniae]WKV21619.1 hypothetical protein [Escherichia coli]
MQRSHILTPSNRNHTKKPLLDDFQSARQVAPELTSPKNHL